MKYYSAKENNGILPFATTQMDLEGIMLSKEGQIKPQVNRGMKILNMKR